jgi:hypothetical protein
MSEQIDLRFSPANIAAMLIDLPGKLQASDNAISQAEQTVKELDETLDIEKVNVSLNATLDGKNAEARKAQLDNAISNSAEVKAAKSAVAGAKIRLEGLQAENKQLSRSFAAWCHVAELKAAQMILMSKGSDTK